MIDYYLILIRLMIFSASIFMPHLCFCAYRLSISRRALSGLYALAGEMGIVDTFASFSRVICYTEPFEDFDARLFSGAFIYYISFLSFEARAPISRRLISEEPAHAWRLYHAYLQSQCLTFSPRSLTISRCLYAFTRNAAMPPRRNNDICADDAEGRL